MWRINLTVIIALTPTMVMAAETAEGLATLNVETVPGYVEIKVNSETIGFAPIRDFALPSGEYVVTAVFNEKVTIEKSVFLKPGTATDVWFYSAEGEGSSRFSTRNLLIGVGLFVVLGLGIAIMFSVDDMQ
jgi:ABC-type transport system substrate-binding protein